MMRRLGDNARPSERFSTLPYLQLNQDQNQESVIAELVEDRWFGDLCPLVLLVPRVVVALCKVDSVGPGFQIVAVEDWM
jgi:hypothetical protein